MSPFRPFPTPSQPLPGRAFLTPSALPQPFRVGKGEGEGVRGEAESASSGKGWSSGMEAPLVNCSCDPDDRNCLCQRASVEAEAVTLIVTTRPRRAAPRGRAVIGPEKHRLAVS